MMPYNKFFSLKGWKVMQPLLPVRKAFLLAALVYVLNAMFSLVVALVLNLTDPAISGTARETWFPNGTALTAPGFFLILFVLMLGLATRTHWLGVIGSVGLTLLAVISGMATLADWGMVQRIFADYLNIATALSVVLLFVSIPATAILGIMTLVLQWRARARPVLT